MGTVGGAAALLHSLMDPGLWGLNPVPEIETVEPPRRHVRGSAITVAGPPVADGGAGSQPRTVMVVVDEVVVVVAR